MSKGKDFVSANGPAASDFNFTSKIPEGKWNVHTDSQTSNMAFPMFPDTAAHLPSVEQLNQYLGGLAQIYEIALKRVAELERENKDLKAKMTSFMQAAEVFQLTTALRGGESQVPLAPPNGTSGADGSGPDGVQ